MENNTFKYLKYATGEIVLVVIGILIALQINNWDAVSSIDIVTGNVKIIDNDNPMFVYFS